MQPWGEPHDDSDYVPHTDYTGSPSAFEKAAVGCRYRRYLYYQGKEYHIKSAPPAIPFKTPVIGMSQIPSSIKFERHAWESAGSQTMI